MNHSHHRSLILLLALGIGMPGARAQEPAAGVRYRGETPAQHDARMQWWREANFGMFIHWGVYAQLGGKHTPGLRGEKLDALRELGVEWASLQRKHR